jgi:hypothetical protein
MCFALVRPSISPPPPLSRRWRSCADPVPALRRGARSGPVASRTATATASRSRDIAERTGSARGLWAALRAIARLAHSGCRARDLHVTPFNGRLFTPGAHRSPNAATWTTKRGGRFWRSRHVPRPMAVRASGSRRRPGSNSSARCARRCSTTADRPPPDGARPPAAARRLARPQFRRPQGAGRSTRRCRSPTTSFGAHSARSFTTHPLSRSSPCASSIRRWAAARSWSPRADTSPGPTKHRWFSRRMPFERHRRARAGRHSQSDRRTVPLRRGCQPDGRAAGPPVALARHAQPIDH